MQAVVLGNTRPNEVLQSPDDFFRRDFRWALADPNMAAIGKLVKNHFEARGLWSDFQSKIVVRTDTVTSAAQAVHVGSVDAAIVWNTVACQYPHLRTMTWSEIDGIEARISAAIIRQARYPQDARRFVEFLRDERRGWPHFVAAGFSADRP
jgi:ABC-type molybdate transport system substrate-binding protein